MSSVIKITESNNLDHNLHHQSGASCDNSQDMFMKNFKNVISFAADSIIVLSLSVVVGVAFGQAYPQAPSQLEILQYPITTSAAHD